MTYTIQGQQAFRSLQYLRNIPVDLTDMWLLVQEIQGPEICELSNLS